MTEMVNFADHIQRQIAFSSATFGPGRRQKGVTEHIQKELVEMEESGGSSAEWVDVAILALDGLWRASRAEHPNVSNLTIAMFVVSQILEKQDKNERRDWPDWRTASPDKAIEHIRESK